MRGVHDRLRARPAILDVVAVEGDVEVPERNLGAGQLADERVQAGREHRTAGVDPDQPQASSASPFRLRPVAGMASASIPFAIRGSLSRVLLDDLVSDAHQRAPHVVTVEHDPLVLCHLAPSWPLRTGLKERLEVSVPGRLDADPG